MPVKITKRTNLGAVQVDLNKKEYLYYKLTCFGGTPAFDFSCEHPPSRLSAGSFPGHPKQVYEWTWEKDPKDPPLPGDVVRDPRGKDTPAGTNNDVYVIGMLFLDITKYTLRVEHRRRDDSLVQLAKDIDYESQDPNDEYQEPLNVFA